MTGDPSKFVFGVWEGIGLAAAVLTIITAIALALRIVFRHGEEPGPVTRGIYDLFLDVMRYGALVGFVLWAIWKTVPYMK
jgi:hypothetical protein